MKDTAKLPECCYAVSPYSGCVCLIYRGDNAYYGSAALKSVDDMNARLGVTKAQAAAMRAAIDYGWSSLQADPANYAADGAYRGPNVTGGTYNAQQQ